MKSDDFHEPMLRLQTIHECVRTQSLSCPAHSTGKPAVSLPTTRINVRFAPASFLELPIKRPTKN
jgi:hypothetical protein